MPRARHRATKAPTSAGSTSNSLDWMTEEIEPPDGFVCGQYAQFGVRPDGSSVVAHSCQTYDDVTQTFGSVLKLASRAPL